LKHNQKEESESKKKTNSTKLQPQENSKNNLQVTPMPITSKGPRKSNNSISSNNSYYDSSNSNIGKDESYQSEQEEEEKRKEYEQQIEQLKMELKKLEDEGSALNNDLEEIVNNGMKKLDEFKNEQVFICIIYMCIYMS
jgi:hypothetical protein